MIVISVIGAGGKMGCRLTDNLVGQPYDLRLVEPGEEGRERLRQRGLEVTDLESAVADSDVVIFAVPDNRIGVVAEGVVPMMKSGATLIVLDAAAPYAGQLPERDDVSFVACHPCHPSVFNNDETEPMAQTDYFGGIAARQDVVIALLSGTEDDYTRAEQIVRAFFAPVVNAHRVSLRDMVLLEPVLAETTAATCVVIIREAMDEAIRLGVPAEAARAFILGHVNVELAIVFGEIGSPFSDGALKAINTARDLIFRPDWKQVFDEPHIRASIDEIVGT